MVYGGGSVASGNDNSDSDTGSSMCGSDCWSKRADLVSDLVSDFYSKLVIFFFCKS